MKQIPKSTYIHWNQFDFEKCVFRIEIHVYVSGFKREYIRIKTQANPIEYKVIKTPMSMILDPHSGKVSFAQLNVIIEPTIDSTFTLNITKCGKHETEYRRKCYKSNFNEFIKNNFFFKDIYFLKKNSIFYLMIN